ICLFHRYLYHRVLHSFPTRRSSDLICLQHASIISWTFSERSWSLPTYCWTSSRTINVSGNFPSTARACRMASIISSLLTSETCRSEEHTSELQSRENLVCRLLLEKK